MIPSIRTAVILAAGMGTRLGGFTKEQPKGFLEIDGQSLIERSISILISRGITDIIIGTGYFHEHFDLLRLKFPGIRTCRNEDYAVTGSMYTLYTLRHLVKDSFLLLESDLLYEPAAIDYLLADPAENIILASGPTLSGDEVFIQFSSTRLLQNMSKDRSVLSHIDGELVGISKLSPQALEKMVSFSAGHYNQGRKTMHYEDAMVGVSGEQDILIKVIEDLAWCEIDDENHLERALSKVYPRILERSQVNRKGGR
jgi:2-aminoethylphosphonate-pyruvate transaminase